MCLLLYLEMIAIFIFMFPQVFNRVFYVYMRLSTHCRYKNQLQIANYFSNNYLLNFIVLQLQHTTQSVLNPSHTNF